MVSPLLNQPLAAPVNLTVSNTSSTVWNTSNVSLTAWLTQGVYGDSKATMLVYWGTQNGGTTPSAWANSAVLGINTNFNPTAFTIALTNLAPNTTYYYAFQAANSGYQAWSQAGQFSTAGLNPSDYSNRMKITFPDYTSSSPLSQFPVLVTLTPGDSGFSYAQFASPSGGDLRFADSGGLTMLPYEINRWNPNGTSTVWVLAPTLAGTNNYIWAYWGNSAATNPPASTTNGAVWQANYTAVWHLEQLDFPLSRQHVALADHRWRRSLLQSRWVGQAASFNGAAYLDAGHVTLPGAFTLSAWVNLQPGAANIQTIFANKPGGWNTDGVSLYIDTYNTSDRAVLLETGDGTTGTTAQSVAGAITDGQWHFIAATVDRANGVGQIYIDGVNQTQSSAVTTDFGLANDFQIARFTDTSYPFHGLIDEARIQSSLPRPPG